MAVLAPNVRGSSGYGRDYSRLADAEKRMDAVDDVIEAARWLKGQPGIDPNRLAIYGAGYGGFLALAALNRDAQLWAAGAVIAGISNLVSFLQNTSVCCRAYEEAEYGKPASDQTILESMSPIHHVGKMATPLIIVHGTNNPYIPLSESEQIVEKLKRSAIPYEYLPVEDEGVDIVRRVNRRKAYGAVAQFLESHLSSPQSG
jgi:dipeptidyl aminopeptidase/acylaminoacyl peptidase